MFSAAYQDSPPCCSQFRSTDSDHRPLLAAAPQPRSGLVSTVDLQHGIEFGFGFFLISDGCFTALKQFIIKVGCQILYYHQAIIHETGFSEFMFMSGTFVGWNALGIVNCAIWLLDFFWRFYMRWSWVFFNSLL